MNGYKSFYAEPFDYEVIKKGVDKIYTYHGDDDPYVPLSMAKDLSKSLGTELKVVEHGGHLNAESGYLSFDVLLEDLKSTLSE